MFLECEKFVQTYQTQARAALLLDVRSDIEVANGALPGAVHIPVDELLDRAHELPKEKTLFIYCRSGGRAIRAQEVLESKGYEAYVAVECGYEQLKDKIH